MSSAFLMVAGQMEKVKTGKNASTNSDIFQIMDQKKYRHQVQFQHAVQRDLHGKYIRNPWIFLSLNFLILRLGVIEFPPVDTDF